MSKICLAVDIGASSGRIIKSTIVNNQLKLEEIYRFKNQMYKKNEHFYWDIDHLFNEIINGLKKVSQNHKEIASIGIDTWAVDYVLLDKDEKRISPVYAYRDYRTNNTMEKLFTEISKNEIYNKTGIQFLQFNTLYQLYEHIKEEPQVFKESNCFLMIPDYLNYLLSGKCSVEFTNATTTQFFNIHKNDWDDDLIKVIGTDKNLYPEVIQPGTILGSFTKQVEEEVNLANVKVITPATHDTGSAVASVPALSNDFAYISSGTWSLMGIESKTPICSDKAHEFNFTNEGGVYGTVRVLKNIMGLWLIQEVKRLYNDKYSFAELVSLAKESEPFKHLINPNNSRFLNPENMIEEIKCYCKETDQPIPEKPGEIARCIFESLAFQYKQVLLELREISDQPINKIHVVGGGCLNKFLDQLCADFTNCVVYAGPVEATAIGNLIIQYITLGEISSLEKAREMINNSFDIEKYIPDQNIHIESNWNRFVQLP